MPTHPFYHTVFWTLVVCLGSAACQTSGDPPDDQAPAPAYRSVENTPDEGTESDQPESSSAGSVEKPSASVRSKAREYQSTIVQALHQEWTPPTMGSERLDTLGTRVVVYVRMNEKGKIVSYEFQQKSGSAPFDQSIRECLETFRGEDGNTLPMPENARLQKALVRHGMNLRNWLVD